MNGDLARSSVPWSEEGITDDELQIGSLSGSSGSGAPSLNGLPS